MTDLLLSDPGEDQDFEGEFAPAAPAPGGAAVASAPAPPPEPDAGKDAETRLDEVQAAVAAALEDAAAELDSGETDEAVGSGGPSGEGLGEDPGGDASAGEPLAEEVVSLMEAVSAELDAAGLTSAEAAPDEEPGSAPGAQAVAGESDADDPPRPTKRVPPVGQDAGEAAGVADEAPPEERSEEIALGVEVGDERVETWDAAEVSVAAAASDPEPATAGTAPSRKTALKQKPDRWAGLRKALGALLARVDALVVGVATRETERLAGLLAGQSKAVRQSLAWLAVWTAFNAGAVWTFLLVFRSAGAEVEASATTQILGTPAVEGTPGAAAPGGPPSDTPD